MKYYRNNVNSLSRQNLDQQNVAREHGVTYNVFDITKTARKAAEQVIKEMGNELRQEARDEARYEAREIAKIELSTMEGKILQSAENIAKVAAHDKAQQIKDRILEQIDHVKQSVSEEAEKAARNAAEKAVKNVAPEVAKLLKPEMKIQIEKVVKEQSSEKIESLIKSEMTSKINNLVTEEKVKDQVEELLKPIQSNIHDLSDHSVARIKNDVAQFEKALHEQYQSLNNNLNNQGKKFECDLIEAKSSILKTSAQSLHESAESLMSMAESTTCIAQDPMYF